MLAPASVLIAIAADQAAVENVSAARADSQLSWSRSACVASMAVAWNSVMTLRFDGQPGQRAVVAAVHQIFPGTRALYRSQRDDRVLPEGELLHEQLGRGGLPETWHGLHARDISAALPAIAARQSLGPHAQDVAESAACATRIVGCSKRAMSISGGRCGWPALKPNSPAEARPHRSACPCAGNYRLESTAQVLIDGRIYGNGAIVALEGEREYRIALVEPAALPQSAAASLGRGARAAERSAAEAAAVRRALVEAPIPQESDHRSCDLLRQEHAGVRDFEHEPGC